MVVLGNAAVKEQEVAGQPEGLERLQEVIVLLRDPTEPEGVLDGSHVLEVAVQGPAACGDPDLVDESD